MGWQGGNEGFLEPLARALLSLSFCSALLLLSLAMLPSLPLLPSALAQEKRVLEVELRGFISPAGAELVGSAVERLEREGDFTALLLTLDTLGGSADSMFKIVESIQASPVPVIGFVYPSGKQALSAGTYILMATDYAAMAPFTTIGSAQPVQGAVPVEEPKVVNFFVEKIKGLARLHGRNETQAARFVTHNDNLLPEEALELGIIEAIARDPRELLEKAHGARVKTLRGERVLDTKGAVIVKQEASVRIALLTPLSNPIVSSLLISIGFLVLILGLASPGYGGEVAGAIMVLLGLLGQGLNVNFIALAMMALGAALLVIEVYTPSFGALGAGGVVALGLGMALMVTQPPEPLLVGPQYLEVFFTSIITIMAAAGGFFGLLIFKAAKAVRIRKKALSPYPLGEGKAVEELGEGKEGYVLVEGEYWRAMSRDGSPIREGQRVKVVEKRGSILIVEALPEGEVKEGANR